MQHPKLNQLFEGNFRIFINGQSESGKTNLLYTILTNPKFNLKQRFKADQFYIISPNSQIDDCQMKLIDYLKSSECNENMTFNEDEQICQNLDIGTNFIRNIYDQQYEAKKLFKQQQKQHQINNETIIYPFYEKLVILDDILGNQHFKTKKGSILDSIITQCRHVNIQIIILSQYFKEISPVVRANISHYFIFNNPKSDEITKFQNEISGSEKSKFLEIYQDATSEQYSCLLVLNKIIPKYKFFRYYNNDQVYQYNL